MEKGQQESSPRHSSTYLPIEDYAVIGDLHTVALVGKNGSIDWCCLPRFDSPSVFGAILDVNKGGYFRIAPPNKPGMGYKQLYLPETNILISRFLTVDGVGEITDFMPIKQEGTSFLISTRTFRMISGRTCVVCWHGSIRTGKIQMRGSGKCVVAPSTLSTLV